jgi:hypothetical protein
MSKRSYLEAMERSEEEAAQKKAQSTISSQHRIKEKQTRNE